MNERPGELILDGVYQVLGELGRGGMGVVFRARHLRLEREVAVKAMLPQAGNIEDVTARFCREVEVCAGLSHPNIVRILDFGEAKGHLYYAMELLEAEDLGHRFESGAAPATEVTAWLSQAADALAYIHSRRLVHRDIKPANLMLSKSGVLTLMDFGLVKAMDRTRLTQEGQLLGTARFLAPEALLTDQITPAIDVYALGLTAWEALVGRRTYTGSSGKELYTWIVQTGAPPLASVRPSVPKPLASLVDRMCSRSPEARPLAVEILAALSPDRVRLDPSARRRTGRVRRITRSSPTVPSPSPSPLARRVPLLAASSALGLALLAAAFHAPPTPPPASFPASSSRAPTSLLPSSGIVPLLSPGYHFSTVSVLSDAPAHVSLELASASYARPTSDAILVTEPEISRLRGQSPWLPVPTPSRPPRIAHRLQLPWPDTGPTCRLVRVTLSGTSSRLVLRDRRMNRATYETFRQYAANVREKGNAAVEASYGGWNGPAHFYPDAPSYCEPPLELSPWLPLHDFELQTLESAAARPDRESAATLVRFFREQAHPKRVRGWLQGCLEAFTFFEAPDLVDQVWPLLDSDDDTWTTPAGLRCVAALCVANPRVREIVRARAIEHAPRQDAARAAWQASGL